jgi:hypothetical protein
MSHRGTEKEETRHLSTAIQIPEKAPKPHMVPLCCSFGRKSPKGEKKRKRHGLLYAVFDGIPSAAHGILQGHFRGKFEKARRGEGKQKNTSIDRKAVSKEFPEPHIAQTPGSLDILGVGRARRSHVFAIHKFWISTDAHTCFFGRFSFGRKAREGEKKRRKHGLVVCRF